MHIPTLAEIKRALHLQETIESLRSELTSIFGGAPAKRGRKPGRKPGRPAALADISGSLTSLPTATTPKAGKKKARRTLSPEAREKIAAAQRRRWAKTKKAAKKAARA
ncbi:MAG TPA: hypothetical protein VEI97_19615 [bacterium]|nr:hypothetical protein [bacterium]